MTILENCTLAPILVRKIDRVEAEKIAMEYLARVKIPEQANKYPGSFLAASNNVWQSHAPCA